MDRREFIQSSGAALAAATAGSRTVFASAPTENRLVFIILRGGLDALHTLPPYADKDYRQLRPTLALDMPGNTNGAIDVDGYFGLHPSLEGLHVLYASKELMFMTAATTQYRSRSHFDGQNLLENGSGIPFGAKDGWLNRAIAGLNGGDRRLGFASGPSVPFILQGDAGVQMWANSALPEGDEDFLSRLTKLYEADPIFAKAFADARGSVKPDVNMSGLQARRGKQQNVQLAARATAEFLKSPNGPRIAVMEIQGWDTHFGQAWRLRKLFEQYTKGLLELKSGLGSTWAKTAVLTVSEFGRTAAENGSRGTDHGTGGIALLAGGAVNGGRIVGRWPGLSEQSLFEGRDLNPVNAYEGIFKSTLIFHLGLSEEFVEDKVFPDSSGLTTTENLFRNTQ